MVYYIIVSGILYSHHAYRVYARTIGHKKKKQQQLHGRNNIIQIDRLRDGI
jgi:hypothetical protein